MDPLLFGLKTDVVFEVFTGIVLLSIIIERGLAVIFEWKWIAPNIKGTGLKEVIALVVSYLVVMNVEFDALAIIFSREGNSTLGYLVTCAVIAGGSKGSMAIFQNWLDWRSNTAKKLDDTI